MNDDPTRLADPAVDADSVRALRDEIARLKLRVAQLDELAHSDSLTGLPNRRSFDRDLDRLLARVGRYGGSGAVLYVDVDGLKRINDSLGHRAGDEALVQVATCLARGLRRSDSVARIGGDEFAVLLESVDAQGAQDTVTRLLGAIRQCDFLYNGKALKLSVAIGVGVIRPDDTTGDVIARADEDMYRRKAAA